MSKLCLLYKHRHIINEFLPIKIEQTTYIHMFYPKGIFRGIFIYTASICYTSGKRKTPIYNIISNNLHNP